MDWLLLTDFSVTTLCQALLYGAIAVLLWRSRHSIAERWLVLFFAGMAGFSLMMFASASVYAPWSLYFDTAAQRLFLLIGLTALVQFAYRFPDYPATWESRGVLAFSGLLLAGNLVWLIQSWLISPDDFRPVNKLWALVYLLFAVLLLLWSLVTLVRQTVRLSRAAAPDSTAGWGSHLWRPTGRAARGTRGFALTFMLLLGLAVLGVLAILQIISSDTLFLFLNLILLAIPFLFALIYLNTTPESTTFMDKLMLVVLALSLAALDLTGVFTINQYGALYSQLLKSDEAQLTAALAAPGRDLQAPLTASEVPTSTVYILLPPQAPYDPPRYQLIFSAAPIFSEQFEFNQQRSVAVWDAAVQEQATTLTESGVSPEVAVAEARKIVGATFWEEAEDLYYYWGVSDGGILRYIFYPLKVNGVTYHIGLEQRSYRTHINTVASRVAYLILWFTGFIIVILPAFFRANLVRPLDQLLAGVRQVNAGEREVTVPVRFADEIGFLTQSFNQMVGSLREADRLKDEFLANTSHELRTPLNGIIGLAESLADGGSGPLTPVQKHSLQLIVISGQRLSALVNDVLDFSKLRHHELQLQLKALDLVALADVVTQVSQPLIGDKPVQLINAMPTDLPLVEADENRVQQILYNLVGNAIKFTETGSVTLAAVVHASPTEARARQNPLPPSGPFPPTGVLAVTVTDTGIGIPADKFKVIFESFQQADGSVARQYGGTGLGLAVTQQLVELHRGEIWVDSAIGQGSRFTFTLPLASAELAAEADAPTRGELLPVAHPLAEAPVTPAAPQFNDAPDVALAMRNPVDLLTIDGQFRLLLVDDDPINLQVLRNHLNYRFLTLVAARSGPEALEIVQREEPFHLILLDVMMPRMSGYEVTRALRPKYPANELPIILLTAKNQVSDLVEGFVSGASDYLTKPVSKNELLARVKTHLRLMQMVSANELLRQANQLKSELIGIAAHDLKNPLSGVIGYTQMILELPVEEEVREMADSIDRSARQMLSIIQQLLHDAALESGQLQLAVRPVNLTELVRALATRRANQANRKQQTMHFDLQPEVIVAGDEQHLRECLDNLIENAIKYSPVQKNIWVSLALDDGFARYEVRDEGLGMSEDDQRKVFGKFQKLSARPTGDESSSGLGLHIVKRVIELHNGRVWATSPGQGLGSRFTILLPQEERQV